MAPPAIPANMPSLMPAAKRTGVPTTVATKQPTATGMLEPPWSWASRQLGCSWLAPASEPELAAVPGAGDGAPEDSWITSSLQSRVMALGSLAV